MKPKKFRIYYDDGSTYSSDPYFAPSTGVQVVIQENITRSVGFDLFCGKDAYYWKDGRWFQCDIPGMWDYLFMYVGPKAVLFGRTIQDDDFWNMVTHAKNEGLE